MSGSAQLMKHVKIVAKLRKENPKKYGVPFTKRGETGYKAGGFRAAQAEASKILGTGGSKAPGRFATQKAKAAYAAKGKKKSAGTVRSKRVGGRAVKSAEVKIHKGDMQLLRAMKAVGLTHGSWK